MDYKGIMHEDTVQDATVSSCVTPWLYSPSVACLGQRLYPSDWSEPDDPHCHTLNCTLTWRCPWGETAISYRLWPVSQLQQGFTRHAKLALVWAKAKGHSQCREDCISSCSAEHTFMLHKVGFFCYQTPVLLDVTSKWDCNRETYDLQLLSTRLAWLTVIIFCCQISSLWGNNMKLITKSKCGSSNSGKWAHAANTSLFTFSAPGSKSNVLYVQ